MRKKFFLMFLLASSVAAFGGVCPMIVGEGRGYSKESADNKADIAIAQSIFSSLASVSHDTLFSRGLDGIPEDYNSLSEITKMESFLPNRQDVRQLKPHYEADGEVVSVRYICRSDAAKPWLASFEAEIAKYSNLAIRIADEKDSQKRNELLSAAASVKDKANWADIVLSSIILDNANTEYAKLKEEFKAAKKKIESAAKSVYDKNYGVGLMPIVPGLAQLYKGHYGRAALIIGSGAALLAVGGISVGNYAEADRRYKDAVLKYNSSKNVSEKNELLRKSKDYKSDRESAQTTAIASFLFVAMLYGYNLIDGWATTPALARWHLAAMPAPSRGGMGTALALTGNF